MTEVAASRPRWFWRRFAVVGAVGACLLAGALLAPGLMRAADSVMQFVPTEGDVVQPFPEVKLAGGTFEGLWGERDRGTWIFQYRGAPGTSPAATLRAQLRAGGWRAVNTSGNETEFLLIRGGQPVHLFTREHADGVQVLLAVGRGNGAQKDKFVRRVIDDRWRPPALPSDAGGPSGGSP